METFATIEWKQVEKRYNENSCENGYKSSVNIKNITQ